MRSGAAAARAPSSAGACDRGRSACRTAQARAGTPLPGERSLVLEAAQRVAVLVELAALLVDHVGGCLRHEILVGELALGPFDLAEQMTAPLLDPCARLFGV